MKEQKLIETCVLKFINGIVQSNTHFNKFNIWASFKQSKKINKKTNKFKINIKMKRLVCYLNLECQMLLVRTTT